MTIRVVEMMRSFRRPRRSARAPEGTSAKRMVAAQMALRMTYWERVRPRSMKRMAMMG